MTPEYEYGYEFIGTTLGAPWIQPVDPEHAIAPWGGQTIRVGPEHHELQFRVTSWRIPTYVNPEEPVIDDIDALVRQQLAAGPQDDYTTNRYDRCPQCHHDWHGLDCANCDCLNTDWLQPERTTPNE